MELFVDIHGDDSAPGTIGGPVASLERALVLSRSGSRDEKTIYLCRGVHFLKDTILMLPSDSGLAIRAYGTEQATLSGGTRLACSWKPFRDGIYVSDAPKDIRVFTQLFADGIRQVRARFPNCPDGRKNPSAGYP